MAVNIGSDKIPEFYIGSDRIGEIYIGSDLIYKLDNSFTVFDGANAADYSGGWQISNEYSNEARNVSLSGNYLRAGKTTGYGPNQAYVVVSNRVAINVTDYTKAVIEYEAVGNSNVNDVWAIGINNNSGVRDGQIKGSGTVSRRTGEIDISNMTGNKFINLYAFAHGGGTPCSVTVYKITLI